MIPYSRSPKAVVLVLNYVPKTIPSSHPNFDKILTLLEDPDVTEESLLRLIEVPKPVITNSFEEEDDIVIKNDQLFYRGYPVNTSLSKRILDLMSEGKIEAAKPYANLLRRAFQNPDRRAVTDLFDWLVHVGLPITPDGFLLAWKAVRDDYRSIHSPNDARFDHHVGNIVEQDRTECDANPDRTCSSGLHFASASYLPNYASGGSRIVALKIDPADVVAFPKDYGWAKGRASRYLVVGEVPLAEVPNFYPQAVGVYKRWGYNGSRTEGLTKRISPRNPFGFAVGQVWLDAMGGRHTIVDINASAPGYPILTDLGRFTARGRFVSDDEVNARDLTTLYSDAF